MKIEIIKRILSKGKNKRIDIIFGEDENKNKMFIVKTRTLISFEKRQISETKNAYSVETFWVLAELFYSQFLIDSLITNKILIKELNNENHFETRVIENPSVYKKGGLIPPYYL